MKLLSVQQVAEKFDVTVRAVQKWAKEGKIDGAMRVGKVWLFPEDAVNSYAIEHKKEFKKSKSANNALSNEFTQSNGSLNAIFKIINGCYEKGNCEQYIQTIDDPKIKSIAEGECMYFKGKFTQSAEILHSHITDSDDALAFYAGAMYAFSNLILGKHRVAQITFDGLRKYMSSLDRNDPEKVAMSIFVMSCVDVFFHSKTADVKKLEDVMHILPVGMRLFSAYIMAHYECFNNDYSRALGIADAAISLRSAMYPIPMIYLHLVAAVSLINMKKIEEAKTRFNIALDLALADGFLSPFIEHHGMLMGLIEVCMKDKAPSEFRKVIESVKSFGHGWHRYRNSEGVKIMREDLSSTEFVVAMLFSKEWSMKEISAYLDISLRMVKQHLSNTYLKLGITRRDELKASMLK